MNTLRQALIRSCAEEGIGPRVVRLNAATYAAFQISHDVGCTYPIEGLSAETLEEAMNQAVTKRLLSHKDHLAIRETSERGAKLHIFAVKRKAQPRYVYRNHAYDRVHDLYLAPVCTIDEAVL